jgi:hypothetical protein
MKDEREHTSNRVLKRDGAFSAFSARGLPRPNTAEQADFTLLVLVAFSALNRKIKAYTIHYIVRVLICFVEVHAG